VLAEQLQRLAAVPHRNRRLAISDGQLPKAEEAPGCKVRVVHRLAERAADRELLSRM
jgi:hypothetical protein